MPDLEIDNYALDVLFPSSIYRINRPEFLETLAPVLDEYVQAAERERGVNEIYPMTMTGPLDSDERIINFTSYVTNIAWDVLDKQGYLMEMFYTKIFEMWGQCHYKTSSMDAHFHGHGAQLCGFYFLEVPENSSTLVFHDPRHAKVHSNLPIKNSQELLISHDTVSYTPAPGDLFFTNSWLTHSFTRNMSNKPVKFIHINIGIVPRDLPEQNDTPSAIVI